MGNTHDKKINKSDSISDIRIQMEEAAPVQVVEKPKQYLGQGMLKVKLTQANIGVFVNGLKYDVKAYFKSNNEITQDNKLMNQNRDKNFKINLNSAKNKFALKMQTIDQADTLTLIINKVDGDNLKIKGEISINILDLYNNKKKRYSLGNDASITLKMKYLPMVDEGSDSEEIY